MVDFFIPKNKSFNIYITITIIRPLRNLQQIEKKQIEAKAYRFTEHISTNNINNIEIVGLNTDKELGELIQKLLEEKGTKITVEEIIINGKKYNFNIVLGNIDQNQEKVNFAAIAGNPSSNYKIKLYKIEEVSEGCNFIVKVDNYIDENDKEIILYFKDYKTEKNIINGRCILSKNNSNNIPCKLNEEVNDLYVIQEYLYYDSKELIAIIMENKTSPFSIICSNENKTISGYSYYNSKQRESNKILAIIISIPVIIIVVIIISIIIYTKFKYSGKKTTENIDISGYKFTSSMQDLE